jgi:hypothetical protein
MNSTAKRPLVTKREKLIAQGKTAVMDCDSTRDAEAGLTEAVEICRSKLASFSSISPSEVNANDCYKIINAMTGASRALIEIDKWRAEKSGMVKVAETQLTQKIRQQLASRPDLVESLHQVMAIAASELESDLSGTKNE